MQTEATPIRFHTLRNRLMKELNVKKRLQSICLWYVLSLMLVSRKHSLDFAARISGKDRSQFGKFLQNHFDIAVYTLKELSKRQAKRYSKALKALESLPWKIVVIIDLTSQGRSSSHSENVKKLNHGKGYFVGHQWTNIVLLIGSMIIPLPPIAFYSRNYCKQRNLEYKTEHKRVIEYLEALDLSEYVQDYRPEDVVVLADSGYDDKRIENLIFEKGWDFVIALKKSRSVKSIAQHTKTSESQGWTQIATFFKCQRRLGWKTVRLFTNGPKRKRKEFRIRDTFAWLKSVGPVQLVCSEWKKRPKGQRKYFACTHLTIKPRQILVAYRLRWQVELFHKSIKMHLGFEDVSAKSFHSVISHVHWVYCAYILLHSNLPGMSDRPGCLIARQNHVMSVLNKRDIASTLQQLTQIGGLNKYKNKLKEVLNAA